MRRYQVKKRQNEPFHINYEGELNDEQRAVVMAPAKPLLVLAGAGSGKTRALVFRVARLIQTGVAPESILLLTFTNRAARNMLTRVEELCGASAQGVRGGTFHHVALGILRQHATELGYQTNFTLIGRDDVKEVMGTLIGERIPDHAARRFPKADVVVDMVSLAINTLTPIHDVIYRRHPRFYAIAEDIAALGQAFMEKKLAMNVMDFDDLLLNWKVLLNEHEGASKSIRALSSVILVDEYQDTNRLQSEIIDAMAADHRNITVVGDDAQSIYGFRGADVNNMLAFEERYPDAERLTLVTNYRSTPQILDLANASLQNSQTGFKKTLTAVRQTGQLPALVSCRNAMQQADFVAQRIGEMNDEGTSLNDIAVLYRAHHHAMEIQLELLRRQIPFQVRSGLRFFEQAHIKDVTAYLRLIYNPDEELSFKRAAKLHSGVGQVSADNLWRSFVGFKASRGHLPREFSSFLQSLPESQAKPGVREFLTILGKISSLPHSSDVGSQISLVLDEFYEDNLFQRYTNAEQRRDDIKQLASYAASYSSLENFLNELLLMQELGVEDNRDGQKIEEKVTLSSVHQAKGLEWSHVFVVWLSDGRFPSELSLREADGIEEERRLFYVALTRAKDSLALCYPNVQVQSDKRHQLMRRSRFIEEICLAGDDNTPKIETWILEPEENEQYDAANEVSSPI